jgi:hypothetical protein
MYNKMKKKLAGLFDSKQKRYKSLMFMLCFVFVSLLTGCSKSSDTDTVNKEITKAQAVTKTEQEEAKPDAEPEKSDAQEVKEGEGLIIPVEQVSSTVQFFPLNVDGIDMEVLAVRDTEGNIRTAFNTCQVCYSSGRGYYKQSGDKLICQNCGNQFTVNQVEVQSGGCNPYPIFEEDKTVTDESITISYDYLKSATKIFANWKTSY